MTPEQFVWWVRGYLAHNVADVGALREALDRVGPLQAVPPAPAPAQPSVFDKLGQQKCPRCGAYSGLGPHFCHGVLTP